MACFRIHTDRLRKGMVIKNDVYSRTGAVLVPVNTPVTKDVVSLLTRHFIDYVMVDYQATASNPADIPSPESVPQLKQQQAEEFKGSFRIAETALSENLVDFVTKDKDLDVPLLLNMLNDIVGKSENEVNLCNMLFKMKSNAEGLYTHSINVALWAQVLAKWMNFEQEDIELVGTAGLLHDIGLLKLTGTAELPAGFTFHEELGGGKYVKHTILGYNLFKNKNIDVRVKQAILTHHERQGGSGFPLKVSLKNINLISRVLAIADTYDTLTMTERGIKPKSPFWILKHLEDTGYQKYDSDMLMTFISHLTNNFIRHTVRLSNDAVGQIVMINKFNLTRPLVQIGNSFIDLAVRKDLVIKEILD